MEVKRMPKQKSSLSKGDKAMLSIARMQILLEKNLHWFEIQANDDSIFPRSKKLLRECRDIIKKAKIPKKYLLAESLDESTNKV